MSDPTKRPTAAAGLIAFGLILAACSTDATTENAVIDTPAAAIESIDDSDVAPEVLGQTEDADESDEADESGDFDFASELEELNEQNTSAAELAAAAAAAEEARLDAEAAAAEREAAEEALAAQLDAEAEQFGDGEAPDPATLVTTNFAIVNVPRGLNLRVGPGTTFGVVVGVDAGRILTGTGITDGNWTQVRIEEFTGWVGSEYLVETDAVDVPPVTEEIAVDQSSTDGTATTLTVVNVDVGVNIRSAPGLEGEIIGNALLGETVTATGNSVDEWTEIRSNGVTGWASSDRLAAS